MDTLPNEILLTIFEQLNYDDLRWRVPSVYRRFRALVQPNSNKAGCSTSKLNKILFRDHPSPTHLKGSIPCKLHPCFYPGRLSYPFTIDVKDVKIWNQNTRTYHQLTLSPLRHENACSPAAIRVNVASIIATTGYGLEPSVYADGTGNGGAVTVLDVMNAAIEGVENVWHMDGLDAWGWDGFTRAGAAEIVDGELKLATTIDSLD